MNSFLVFAVYITIGWIVAYLMIDYSKPDRLPLFVVLIWPVVLIIGSLLVLQEWWKKKMEDNDV